MESRPQRRRRFNNDLNAEFRYHAGGALFFPRQTSADQVLSVSLPPTDSVPSAVSLHLPDPILSEHVAANDDDGSVSEESHHSSINKEKNNPSSSPESNSDTSEKLKESDVEYQSSESEEESEDDSSVYSSEYDNDDNEPLANNMRIPKRKHQEDQSQKGKGSEGVTRPTKRYKIGSKENEKWNQRMEELKAFKTKHGHCRVPSSSSSLYNWLKDQLTKHLNPSHSRYLRDISERERRTKEVESVLGTTLGDWTSHQRTTDSIKWDARLDELKRFKAKHGHSRVPKSSGALYEWLCNQRTKYLNPNHSLYLRNVPERERRTKELEPVLGTKVGDLKNQQRTTDAIKWDGCLEELKAFNAKHGHCRVPESYGKLFNWLRYQRADALNPNSTRCLKDVIERERRTKELELLLGKSRGEWSTELNLTEVRRTTEGIKWDGRLEEVKTFKAKHGHCRVPKSSGSLYIWLKDQRTSYLNPNSPRCLQDVPERKRRTKELEFILGAKLGDPTNQQRTTDAIKWDAHLEELKKFKAKHGHCRVPKSHGTLGDWLRGQRNKVLNLNHSVHLKNEPERERRTKELESVLGSKQGEWASHAQQQRTTARAHVFSATDAIKWDGRLEELKAFNAKHGHCRVPESSRKLFNWLRYQRLDGLNPNSTRCLQDVPERERRTKALESVLGAKQGDWQRTKEAMKWDAHLEELKAFKAKHGHCRVPKSSRALYKWLQRQRNVILKPGHTRYLQDVPERKRRTKELESVLGAKVGDWSDAKRTRGTINWDARLNELKAFKAKHGHCRVPESVVSLHCWLYNQRKRFLNPNHLECLQDFHERERRTKELESILGAKVGDSTNHQRSLEAIKWDGRLEELKTFKTKHGHCRIPASSGSLHDWLKDQRNKSLNPNSPFYLKDVPERERRTKELESVHGNKIRGERSTERNTTNATILDARLEELKTFKAKHGTSRCLAQTKKTAEV